MAEGLARKLEKNASTAAAVPCLVVDDRHSFACEFQPLDHVALVLPYQHLASIEAAPNGETLSIFFSSHEVRIGGANLRLIKDAMATSKNLLVRAVEPRWKTEYKHSEVFVSSVQISKRNNRTSEAEDAPKDTPLNT